MRPLYSEIKDKEIVWEKGNTGLWYDKFCNQWCRNPEKRELEAWTLESFKSRGDDKTTSPKKDWIDTVTGKCGEDKQLAEARARTKRLLEAHHQLPLFYKLESNFVTGLGREHPVENGFAWHHSLGTPYLPGSSVKGMVRAWAEVWHKWSNKPEDEMSDGEKAEVVRFKKAELKRIFGSESKDNKDFQVGSVIFLDVLPTAPVQLKADIMTPHYTDYYEGKSPPADWLSPTPIPFLVVEAGASFIFGILPRRNDEKSRDDCGQVQAWLKDALCWTGAGAKTAVGYGRFVPDKAAMEEAKKQLENRRKAAEAKAGQKQREDEIKKQTAGKSDLYIELFKQSIQNRWTEPVGKDGFVQMGVIEGWLEKLEADPQQDAAEFLGGLIEEHFPGLLENPDEMGGKRNDKPVFKDRQRTFAKRILKLMEEA